MGKMQKIPVTLDALQHFVNRATSWQKLFVFKELSVTLGLSEIFVEEGFTQDWEHSWNISGTTSQDYTLPLSYKFFTGPQYTGALRLVNLLSPDELPKYIDYKNHEYTDLLISLMVKQRLAKGTLL